MSLTMATLDSVQLLSEAAFGCEHLAVVLSKDEKTAGQFKDRFRKQYQLLAPFSKPETVAVPTTGLRTVESLKPKYHCLSCPEVCLSTNRADHTAETGHAFYMESRNRFVFCEKCLDFIYDHVLDRLRGPAGKYEVVDGRAIWAEDSASEVYVKNNAYKNPCINRGARGVWNMGQTCYQASILQAFLHDPTLNAYFLGGGHDVHTCQIKDCLACATAEVFMEFNSAERNDAVSAATLLHHGWQKSKDMAGYRQQDAHEYFQFLVNGLHSSTPGHVESYDKPCECFFHQMFYGELRSSVMCHKCGQTTNTHDPMADLSLDVQLQHKKRKLGRSSSSTTGTLIGCLDSFTAAEDLHADAAYHCEKCGNTPQRASKRLQIRKLPVMLCMQLKRYEHSSNSSEKMNGHIDFPLSVNMLPYTVKKDSLPVDMSQYMYDLTAVIVHQGTMDSGHYFAYTRLENDTWVLMDDNRVTVAGVAEVLRQDAYLLFYSVRSLRAQKAKK
ncbi:Peptidase C19 ubiquitin carboxyl-terminal hydrolase 2 [Penicillium paradoxum]|uniref:Peptidase C19 ubiquitin carboxyl-terminal hydrolase 2 n=1 Tax=Penicillium paradoxum TaxID=176176 RepID=UPI0025484858|nr:Peptidase C19 ubiquitin carboxyl-terminal hydrolase 2 [Penicillium paradoxum]KAJ5779765.1 Peptidase C19 ubiquitin carboxyl-terminal hydrolase 2 [Penicillium paradoxum]